MFPCLIFTNDESLYNSVGIFEIITMPSLSASLALKPTHLWPVYGVGKILVMIMFRKLYLKLFKVGIEA